MNGTQQIKQIANSLEYRWFWVFLNWVLDINLRLETIISSESRPVPAR